MSETAPAVNLPRRRLRGPSAGADRTAAVVAFANRGYDATSLGEVASAAGVTRTVMYDHFPTKRSLFLQVLDSQHQLMLSEIARGITSEGGPRERVRATLASYLRFTREHPAARRLLLDPIPSGDPELDLVVRGYLEDRSNAISGLLATDLAGAGVDLDRPACPSWLPSSAVPPTASRNGGRSTPTRRSMTSSMRPRDCCGTVCPEPGMPDYEPW